MIQDIPLYSKACHHIAQAFSIGKLSEYHGKELVPARKIPNVTVPTVSFDAFVKLIPRDEIRHLRIHISTDKHTGRVKKVKLSLLYRVQIVLMRFSQITALLRDEFGWISFLTGQQ